MQPIRIGSRIAEARRAAGFSQPQLAKAIGCHVRSVAGWEGNGTHPRPEKLALIAAATGRPVAWFYEHEEAAA